MPEGGKSLNKFRRFEVCRTSGLPITPRLHNLCRMASPSGTAWTWLRSGDEVFRAMLDAIEAARESICLESYIFSAKPIGVRFRDALVRAVLRGVRVRVLLDSIG